MDIKSLTNIIMGVMFVVLLVVGLLSLRKEGKVDSISIACFSSCGLLGICLLLEIF